MEEINIIKNKNNTADGKVYLFSNENVNSFKSIYNFDNATVLSVIGSGDQYFSSLLFGAQHIDLFDFNARTIYYFFLKYISIKILSYDDFIRFYSSRLEDIEIYKKLRKYLPKCILEYFDTLYKNKNLFSSYLIQSFINIPNSDNRENISIPYLDKGKFYQLKNILMLKETYPDFYIFDIRDLYKRLNSQYDVMLFSNIFAWINMRENQYINFLKKNYFRFLNSGGAIQMYYTWCIEELLGNFNNVEKKRVKSAFNSSLKDYVFSLRKE